MDDNDREAQRQTAAYSRHIAWLRHTQPDMSDERMDAEALQKVDEAVYGVGAVKVKGEYQQVGIGSKGRENHNHLAAILKYTGREAYDREVARIWRETPDHAKRLGLSPPAPPPART